MLVSTPFHPADPSQEPSARRSEHEGEATVPHPLPEGGRRGVRMALVAIVIAIVAVALVILL